MKQIKNLAFDNDLQLVTGGALLLEPSPILITTKVATAVIAVVTLGCTLSLKNRENKIKMKLSNLSNDNANRLQNKALNFKNKPKKERHVKIRENQNTIHEYHRFII